MQASTLFICVVALCFIVYYFGYKRSIQVSLGVGGIKNLHSLPSYYGSWTALWAAIPALFVLALWILFQDTIMTNMVVNSLPENIRSMEKEGLNLTLNNIRNLAGGGIGSVDAPYVAKAVEYYKSLKSTSAIIMTVLVLLVGIIGGLVAWKRVQPELRARNRVEKIVNFMLISCASLAILTTVGILLSVLFESIRFFEMVPFWKYLFGTHWSPQSAFHSTDGASFGAIPLFVGTMLISIIALLIAVPVGLMAAIYLSEYASNTVRSFAKPMLEILAGVPTVVYGFFAALTVAPFLRDLGADLGISIASESALACGLVMGVMIIPFVSSLSDDVINAVPQSLRDGSLGMGATKSETIKNVILPAALPGIVGSILLAASRAIGETMIVVMAASLAANLSINPLEPNTTVTVQIVTLLTGDQEFDSAKTLAAFALGLTLFIVTLVLNVIALRVVRKYREQYE